MRTVITKSGNFVVVTKDGIPMSRPYLNHCPIGAREIKKKDCEMYNISPYFEQKYGKGMFVGYDRGYDLGIDEPYAKQILGSNILLT
jgi:hypothetical protein